MILSLFMGNSIQLGLSFQKPNLSTDWNNGEC